ncbi:hypothetical protein BZG36_00275 [Bifiguratus adelaidae]|uniref:Aerobactin siderophore biosynthesis IucA/IucC N-terminal domain-containing protein n=1 Tax=Bifiguratus adelaidae TaxID=1938954 RepID=A0A261Y7S1_9FUNG|nr:hypothetical protein BZG36_00275 [Bifiguratus adelaidae]
MAPGILRDTNKFYDKASFAITSRLVSCMVNEGLATATFVRRYTSLSREKPMDDAWLSVTNNEDPNSKESILLGVVSLAEKPIMLKHGKCDRIGYLDPESLISPFKLAEGKVNFNKGALATADTYLGSENKPTEIWDRYCQLASFQNDSCQTIREELQSSVDNLEHTYRHYPLLPTLQSSALEWEQSFVEGHATHPMCKARYSLPPMEPIAPGSFDFQSISLRAIIAPQDQIVLSGPFKQEMKPIWDRMAKMWSDELQAHGYNARDHLILPVHPLQIPNIADKFPHFIILPDSCGLPAKSLASVRSVVLDDNPIPGHTLKLALGLKISSALRTVTPFTTYFGPNLYHDVIPVLQYDREALCIQSEVASAVAKHDDTDIAKHCSVVIRESGEYGGKEESKGLKVIVAGALVERDMHGVPYVISAFELRSAEQRTQFFRDYTYLAIRAFLPPLLNNGLAFEAHDQNTLIAVDPATRTLKYFLIRDFGGVKIHPETVQRTLGVHVDALPGSTVLANDVSECWKLLWHTLIFGQLYRLMRALHLHLDGTGWRIVREALHAVGGSAVWKYWGADTVEDKSLLTMKMEGLYRDYIYHTVPNLIHYRNEITGIAPLFP